MRLVVCSEGPCALPEFLACKSEGMASATYHGPGKRLQTLTPSASRRLLYFEGECHRWLWRSQLFGNSCDSRSNLFFVANASF